MKKNFNDLRDFYRRGAAKGRTEGRLLALSQVASAFGIIIPEGKEGDISYLVDKINEERFGDLGQSEAEVALLHTQIKTYRLLAQEATKRLKEYEKAFKAIKNKTA